MATPKFDRMSVEFSKRINDPVAAEGTDGKFVTSAVRELFLNQALQALFGMYWEKTGGDPTSFHSLFPELVVPRTVTLSSSKYTIATPNLDFKKLVEAVPASKYATILPATKKSSAEIGYPSYNAGSANNPVAVESGGIIYVYPAASFVSSSTVLTIIVQPLDPTTGGYLTGGGSYDSPFAPNWEEEIIQTATRIFDKDKGNTD
jgi:hypothetical protein